MSVVSEGGAGRKRSETLREMDGGRFSSMLAWNVLVDMGVHTQASGYKRAD